MSAASRSPSTGRPKGASGAAPPVVLTIAGSDSGAGAGIQADARAIHALGGYAATVITAITAQNTRGVIAWRPVSASLISSQIEAVARDLRIAAAKTGLLPGAAAVLAVVRALPARLPLIVDPVLASSSGTRFLSAAAVRVLRQELLPRATLVTPNWAEAAALTGRTVASHAEVEAAARALLETGCRAVLLKGGHAPGRVCRDFFMAADGGARWFERRRISTPNTHGTGCTLSAAIAAALASGESLPQAIERALALLTAGLRHGRHLRWGRGTGPAFPGMITAALRASVDVDDLAR